MTDPVDQLVPPPPSRVRLGVLLAGALIVLALVAAAPVSGALRPNLVVSNEYGSAGGGIGTGTYMLRNQGWTTATIQHFDLGLEGVETFDETIEPATPPNEAPLASHPSTVDPVSVPPGREVLVRFRFTYDCAHLDRAQGSTIQARGVTPIWVTADLATATSSEGLANLIQSECTQR